MTTDIKKSVEVKEPIAGSQFGTAFYEVKNPAKQRWNLAKFRAAIVVSMLGIGLILSALSNYLFFKELLVATAIIGMVVLLKTARHPAIIISGNDDDRAHLN